MICSIFLYITKSKSLRIVHMPPPFFFEQILNINSVYNTKINNFVGFQQTTTSRLQRCLMK